MASSRPPKRLVVFCDGTWVGRETTVANAPASNIRQLANMVGEVNYIDSTTTATDSSPILVHPIITSSPNITAGYQEGVGLNKTFLEYIWDGATASAIGDEIIAVYRFIVEHYTSDHEIWLFGFSRGAFTVRCVAGMINNCGIVRNLPSYTPDQLHRLCYDVFRTYRSPLPQDSPHSRNSEHLKGNAARVWQVKRPIRFVGIIDTVGALGIPRLSSGTGFDWAEFQFFDQTASSVIQHIYHAPALHDRLWTFQPCLVFESEDEGKDKPVITQRWFPGTHYDLGRMTFRFIRQRPSSWIEGVLGFIPDLLSRTIYPNEVLSDCVLRFVLEGVRDLDNGVLMPGVEAEIERLNRRIVFPALNTTGSGDIYTSVLNYAPAGVLLGSIQRVSRLFASALNSFLPRLGTNIQALFGIKTIVGILTATADRRIPGTQADVFLYQSKQVVTIEGEQGTVVVSERAKMEGVNEWGRERYESKTYESFLLWREVFGRTEVNGAHSGVNRGG